MKIFVCQIALVLVSSTIFAQNKLDSLIEVLSRTPSDTNRVLLLGDIAFQHWSGVPQNGIQYAQGALHLADSLKFERGKAKAFNAIGVLKWALGDYPEAIRYYKKSLEIAESLNDYPAASNSYNNIAIIYSLMNNYDDAILFFEKSVAIDKRANDLAGVALTLNNIGSIYTTKKEYQKGLDAFKESLQIYKRLGTADLGSVLNNIGENYAKQKKHALAITYYKQAEIHYLNSDHKRGLSMLYNNMGESYLQLLDYKTSGEYINKGLTIAIKSNINERISESYLSLSKLDSANGNFKQALLHFKIHDQLTEQIFKEDRTRELNEYKVQLDVKGREKENELLKSQTKLQEVSLQKQRYIIVGAIALLTLASSIAFLYFRYYKSKLEANMQLKELNNKIMSQREELRNANEEIRSMNDNLENLVAQRTNHIAFQNQQLTEYAFFNSHKIRGPLARILGIIGLINIDPSRIDPDGLIAKLSQSAEELDTTIHEITEILQSDQPKPKNGDSGEM